MVSSTDRKALLKASSFCNHDMVMWLRSESGATLCRFLNNIFVILPPRVFSNLVLVNMRRMQVCK